MPTVALTDRFCSTAKPIKGRTDYFDATVQGLALRVTEHGHRSWCFHYRSPRDGKRARATIGNYPATSLASARGKALEARGHVDAGQDPRLVLAGQATAGLTVTDLVDLYVADPERATIRSKAEIERRLCKNVVAIIGAVKLAELRRRDARNVTDTILRRGKKTEATRVFEDLRSMVRWAVANEYLDANPLDGMSKPAEPTPRTRVLSDGEIRTLWTGLPETLTRSVQCQRIIKLCLATAQRVGEVAGIVPSELDLKAREWRLPGSRVKNAYAHVVPLSDLAIEILKEAAAEAGKGAPLFPCGDGSLAPRVVAKTIYGPTWMTVSASRHGRHTICAGRRSTIWPSSAFCRLSSATLPITAPSPRAASPSQVTSSTPTKPRNARRSTCGPSDFKPLSRAAPPRWINLRQSLR